MTTPGPYGNPTNPYRIQQPTTAQYPAMGADLQHGYPVSGYPQPSPAGYQPAPGYPLPPGYPGPGYGFGPALRNGIGTAGLVLGIIGLVFCWFVWVGVALCVLAVIFGGVGLGRAARGEANNRGSAMAGLVLGIIGLALAIILWVTLFAAVATIR